MTTLITGASGFVGSYLASKFLEKKHNLILINKKKIFSINKNLIDQVDITDLSKLERLFKKKIDCVIHCASLNEKLTNKYKDLAYKTAIKGTENLLKLSVKYKVKKFFYFSVLQVYGKEIFGHLDGMYAFSIYDQTKQKVYIAKLSQCDEGFICQFFLQTDIAK